MLDTHLCEIREELLSFFSYVNIGPNTKKHLDFLHSNTKTYRIVTKQLITLLFKLYKQYNKFEGSATPEIRHFLKPLMINAIDSSFYHAVRDATQNPKWSGMSVVVIEQLKRTKENLIRTIDDETITTPTTLIFNPNDFDLSTFVHTGTNLIDNRGPLCIRSIQQQVSIINSRLPETDRVSIEMDDNIEAFIDIDESTIALRTFNEHGRKIYLVAKYT
jgi:hypothetical protein